MAFSAKGNRRRVSLTAGLFLMAVLMFAGVVQAQISQYSPVTDEMLVNRDPADWLSWRGNYGAWGYSSLDQINKDNVEFLQLAWAWPMEPGMQEGEPLVHDGIMFLVNAGDVIHALDAKTGSLIWEYRRDLPANVAPTATARGLALYKDYVYLAASDAALVALDAKTGKVAWEQQVADWQQGANYSSAPLVANGLVIAGMTCGVSFPGGCFITAHDPDTGEEVWRVNTVAQPGDFGDDTWDPLPVEARHGGSAWITGSYDPELNLIYWGTAQPYPWTSELRGTYGDALYTNSTLAINADTGELEWYFQYVPGDTWDLDEHFEQVLIDTEVDGELRQLLVRAGKRGIIYALDRTNGEFIYAQETVLQTTIESIDPVTGVPTIDPDTYVGIGDTKYLCPAVEGGKDWPTMAYNPELGTIYIPLNNTCGEWRGTSRGTGLSFTFRPAPDKDGLVGRVDAWKIDGPELAWKFEEEAVWTGSMLATGGGLVFGGDAERRYFAFDEETGEVLWQTRLPGPATGFPITYSVDGQQFVAVPAGSPGYLTMMIFDIAPETYIPSTGNALLVFALPESVR